MSKRESDGEESEDNVRVFWFEFSRIHETNVFAIVNFYDEKRSDDIFLTGGLR